MSGAYCLIFMYTCITITILLVCPINKVNILQTCKIDKVGNTKAFSLTRLILLYFTKQILTCTHNNCNLHVICFCILNFVILHVWNTMYYMYIKTLFNANASNANIAS